MASIAVGIHPDPAAIRARHIRDTDPFSILEINVEPSRLAIFVHDFAVLDALQAALDEIRANMTLPEGVFHGHPGGELPFACPQCWEPIPGSEALVG